MTLPYSPVDPHSPIPLYHQIYLDLRQMVQKEIIPAGSMLPPEVEICKAYHVGRQTVRQAISRLVDENLLERFAGKGTFVRYPINLSKFFLDRSFTQQMREMGRSPNSRILNIESGIISADKFTALKHLSGAPYLGLDRLRLGDNEPICHQTSTILTTVCPGIESENFEEVSLYEVLSSRYHIFICRFDHIVRAVAANDFHVKLLKVAKDAPLLFVATSAFSDDGNLVEYSESYYRADRYEYSTSQVC
jgi:GntR family transcriptional regulator